MRRLLDLVAKKSTAAKEKAVSSIIENLIFPWYENKTGKFSRPRLQRQVIAEKVEQSLGSSLWVMANPLAADIYEEDYPDLPLEEDLKVLNVFPKPTQQGDYDLFVLVSDLDNSFKAAISLSIFLRDFYPTRELTFRDWDA